MKELCIFVINVFIPIIVSENKNMNMSMSVTNVIQNRLQAYLKFYNLINISNIFGNQSS